GRIRLESPSGVGASFYVELPVTGGKLPPAPLTRTKLPTAAGAPGGSILVVEDEEQLARAVVDALRDEGYLVDHAADGEVALERIGGRGVGAGLCALEVPALHGDALC